MRCPGLAAVSVLFFAAGCAEPAFQGGARQQIGMVDDGAPPPSRQDKEGEHADPPQEVSGAFLSCVRLAEADDGESEGAAFGCRVERGGTMVDLVRNPAVWRVERPDGAPVGLTSAAITPLGEGSAWHVRVRLLDAELRVAQLAVFVDWGGAGKPERLSTTLDAGAAARGALVGLERAFRVGNDDYSASHCQGPIRATPLAGAAVSWPITVAADGTRVTIGLNGLCGVDYDGLNEAALLRGGAVVARVRLRAGGASARLPEVVLAAGEYVVTIRAHAAAYGDRDDFVVGGLWVDANGAVGAGTPTVE